MRKFTTSLFIALLALLALPEKAWAEDVYLLTAQTIKGTTGNYNVPSNHKFESAGGTVYTYTFTNSEASGDIYFRIGVSGWKDNMQPYTNDDPLTINGDPYSITSYGGTKAWKLTLENEKYSSYTITVDISESNRYVKVTATESGASTTYDLVYLVDKSLSGKLLHTWLKGTPDKGITVWNSRPTIGSGDFASTITYNGTEYYTKTFSVDKSTADSYKQIGAKIENDDNLTSSEISSSWDNVQYIIVTSSNVTIVENSATMYTVTVLSADETMGTVSPASVSVNGTTSATVTATPNTADYEFVKWTATEGVTVADESSPETTVTATQPGTLTANFKATSTGPDPDPTPTKNIPGFYLVGDFLHTDKSINYNCRYFKLSEGVAAAAMEDVEQYSINIPTTLAVNVQVLAINEDGSTALYGPNGELTINKENPTGSDTTTGDLVPAEKTPTNYFKFEDRTTGRDSETPDANDGIYTITITVTNGVPTNYTITHDPLKRVAYYLPNTPDASVKESLNSRDQETGTFNNVFFGRVYLPAGVSCYVLSNYLGNYDYDKKTDTKTKLYLQGNKTGGNPDEGSDDHTKVYPITRDNGSRTDAKPFKFSDTEIVAMNLEYAPRRGKNDDGYKAENIYGEVIRSQKGTQAEDGTSITVPTIKVLKMVGPAVGDDTWDYNKGVVMDYNMAEQCWEATINTTANAGAKFRFVANDTWGNSWQEDGTEDKKKAKIPYTDDDPDKGHAATAADPNEVSYINTLTSAESRDTEYDIIFNRDAGKWRVRFYFTSVQIDENNYKYIFKYTINGYKSVLRTYCSKVAQKPTADSNIKVYGAYAFDGDEAKKSGTIKLYEMNYIPANEGVILYSTNTIDDATIETVMEPYTPTEGETKYINIPDDKYENYLVGTLENTTVNASEFVGEERTHRNFFFNYLKNTGYYKQGETDYLGFFRIKSGSTCKANHAYLSLPTNILAWNGQTFGEVMDQYEESGDTNNLTTKGMRIIFSDGSDWDDNTTTGISVIPQAKPADDAYYTLQGVRVAAPAKGIYIHKGKKIIVK